MISGVFSLISQAVSFQYFPNVKIMHTSKNQMGQVCILLLCPPSPLFFIFFYIGLDIPEINYLMMVITIVIVVVFQHSSKLAAAYPFFNFCIIILYIF